MPTTSAVAVDSGPPELPGLTAASNWIRPCRTWSLSGTLERAVEPEMTPALIEPYSPNGLPTTNASLADADRARVAERRRRRGRPAVRWPDDGDVVLRLAGDDLAADVRAVGEGQVDRVGVRDDVEAGQDVAGGVDHDARARRPRATAWPRPGDSRLDQHERGLDGRVDRLGEGRGRVSARRARRDRLAFTSCAVSGVTAGCIAPYPSTSPSITAAPIANGRARRTTPRRGAGRSTASASTAGEGAGSGGSSGR